MLRGDPANIQRAFTGVYEFTGLQPGSAYQVDVTADGVSASSLATKTLPAAVPTQLDRSFNVLLVSCFHQSEDRNGIAGTIVSQLKATSKPHLAILAGDQVYLDLPTLKDFPDDLAWLAEKFEQDYKLNWSGPPGYSEVLAAAPSISMPDDHEYWNNFPHASPFIANSRTAEGRRRWREAAEAAYAGFQLAYPAVLGEAVTLDVEPLSFFFADTRTLKDFDRNFTLSDAARNQLDQWVTHVIDHRMFAVLVSGQSLLSKPAGKFTGAVGDYDLANYKDYGQIMLTLQRLSDAGRPALLLTGDVHWGRVVTSTDLRTGRTAFAEVISSPSSLVTTIGADQFKTLKGTIGGLFGKKDPWPRHSEPDPAPSFLASDFYQGRFPCSVRHGQRGNHVVMLGFRRQGNGLELRITYWPISRDAQLGQPIEVNPIELTPAL
jgi:hypothetical protein